MFRLKTDAPPVQHTLPVRRLWTVGASGSIALSSYTLVGYCISQVAGASTLVGVAVSAAIAVITGLAYVELTKRTQLTGSPYSFCYAYLGELPAFVVGWAVVGECCIGAALMAKTVTYYISFLTKGSLLDALHSCCSLGGAEPRLWAFFDPVALGVVLVLGVACAINSYRACQLNQLLLFLNFVAILFTIAASSSQGSESAWSNRTTTDETSSIFVPDEYGPHGVFQASAIYMHVFLSLATTATIASQARGSSSSLWISMAVTVIVAVIAVSKATSVSLLAPYPRVDKFTPVATYMRKNGLEWVAVVNSCGAIVASTAGVISTLVLSANTLEQMASDSLLWGRLAARHPSISPGTTTLLSTALTALVAMFHDMEGMILCLSSGTFLVFQALLIAVMVSRSHASRETALLIVLKFTWLLYFFVTPALVIITETFAEKRAVLSAVQGILSAVVLMFLQLAINRDQLDIKVVLVQVLTSFIMGFSSYLMYQLHPWAWFRFFIWAFIGILVYFLYGYRKSRIGRGIVDLDVVPHDECMRSLEAGIDNPGFQHELAQMGVGWGRRSQRSVGGHSYQSARSQQRESFSSAREADTMQQQSFKSVNSRNESESRQRSFKSARGSVKSNANRSRKDSFYSMEETNIDEIDGPISCHQNLQLSSKVPMKPALKRASQQSSGVANGDALVGTDRATDRHQRLKSTTSNSTQSSVHSALESNDAELADSKRFSDEIQTMQNSGRLHLSAGNCSSTRDESSGKVTSDSDSTMTDATITNDHDLLKRSQLRRQRKSEDSPVTSRPATTSDLMPTPPATHKEYKSPKTVKRQSEDAARRRSVQETVNEMMHRRRSSLDQPELLIDPRKLYEELYSSGDVLQPKSKETAFESPGKEDLLGKRASLPFDNSTPKASNAKTYSENVIDQKFPRKTSQSRELLQGTSQSSFSAGGSPESMPPYPTVNEALFKDMDELYQNTSTTKHEDDHNIRTKANAPSGHESISFSDIPYDTDDEVTPRYISNCSLKATTPTGVELDIAAIPKEIYESVSTESSDSEESHRSSQKLDDIVQATDRLAMDQPIVDTNNKCTEQLDSDTNDDKAYDQENAHAVEFEIDILSVNVHQISVPEVHVDDIRAVKECKTYEQPESEGLNPVMSQSPFLLVARELTTFDSETSLEQVSDPGSERQSAHEQHFCDDLADRSSTNSSYSSHLSDQDLEDEKSKEAHIIPASRSSEVRQQSKDISKDKPERSASREEADKSVEKIDFYPRQLGSHDFGLNIENQESGGNEMHRDAHVEAEDQLCPASTEKVETMQDSTAAPIALQPLLPLERNHDFEIDYSSNKNGFPTDVAETEYVSLEHEEQLSGNISHEYNSPSCSETTAGETSGSEEDGDESSIGGENSPHLFSTDTESERISNESFPLVADVDTDEAAREDVSVRRIAQPEHSFIPSATDESNIRQVIRKQMRLPSNPDDTRRFLRTPTPPDLLAFIGVANEESVKLTERYQGDSASGDKNNTEENIIKAKCSSDGPEWLPAQYLQANTSDDHAVHRASPDSMGMPDLSLLTERGSNSMLHKSEGDSDNNLSAGCAELTQSKEILPTKEMDAPTVSGSPVILRKHQSAPPSLTYSAQYTPAFTESATRFESLPPIDSYRPAYSRTDEVQLRYNIARAPTEQRARDTMIRDSFLERASSFEAVNHPPSGTELNSSGLRVNDDIDRVLERLAARNTSVAPAASAAVVPQSSQGMPPPTTVRALPAAVIDDSDNSEYDDGDEIIV